MDHWVKPGGDEYGSALYIRTCPAASGLLALELRMTERSSEGLDVRRRKLLFRAWRRGVREMDLIIGRFADVHIDTLDDTGLDDFEHLIEAPNAALYAWVVGAKTIPADYDTAVLTKLKEFHRHAGKMRAQEDR